MIEDKPLTAKQKKNLGYYLGVTTIAAVVLSVVLIKNHERDKQFNLNHKFDYFSTISDLNNDKIPELVMWRNSVAQDTLYSHLTKDGLEYKLK
jgi:hypothetical protein